MSARIYTDNSNLTCSADEEDEEVWAYAPACEHFEPKGSDHE